MILPSVCSFFYIIIYYLLLSAWIITITIDCVDVTMNIIRQNPKSILALVQFFILSSYFTQKLETFVWILNSPHILCRCLYKLNTFLDRYIISNCHHIKYGLLFLWESVWLSISVVNVIKFIKMKSNRSYITTEYWPIEPINDWKNQLG